jgi:hypothetical protein
MPSLKKPLFAPPPPATLDHFFTKADASINNRSASSTSSSFQAPKRVKAGLSSSRRIKRAPQRTAEIIVLDSDDSDDVPVVRATRKRKAKDHRAAEGSSSSDVEVVETDDAHEGNGKKSKTVFPLDESLHFAEFGRPKLLIPAEDAQRSTGGENSLAGGSGGIPEGESSVPASADWGVSARPCVPAVIAPTSKISLENLIKIEDEWGTGDDELVRTIKGEFDEVLELTDDDEVEDVLKFEDDLPSASCDDNLDQCPLCRRSLTSLSLLVSSLSTNYYHTSSNVSRIRTYNHTLMTAATPFLPPHPAHTSLPTTRLRHHGSLNAKSSLTATRSLSSCPRARQTTHGRKPKWPRAARRKQMAGEERRHSSRSCRACPSPSMLSVMVRSLV